MSYNASIELKKRCLKLLEASCDQWQWGGRVQEGVVNLQTIDPKSGLIIAIHQYRPYGSRSGRQRGEIFDPVKHDHWHDLEIRDPSNRWGRAKLVHVSSLVDDETGIIQRMFKMVMAKARLLSSLNKRASVDIALNAALDLMEGTAAQ